ncbi:hypothetical protein AZE42_12678 [Rhizopogon vesiculosus]|uniref:Uncharacterized protein n=1 Tax=Rhizopogon vesiculosus TaxID=180088 RepID=A0A1J8Q9F2_9AGAM|nr:hypothetical protein AZE42_12678 [Rhizopogon vesiculosus]
MPMSRSQEVDLLSCFPDADGSVPMSRSQEVPDSLIMKVAISFSRELPLDAVNVHGTENTSYDCDADGFHDSDEEECSHDEEEGSHDEEEDSYDDEDEDPFCDARDHSSQS